MFNYFIDALSLILESGLLNWFLALCCISIVIFIAFKIFVRCEE